MAFMNRLTSTLREHAFAVGSFVIALVLMVVVVDRVTAAPTPPANFTDPIVASAEPTPEPSVEPSPEPTVQETKPPRQPTFVPVKPKPRDIDDDDDPDDDGDDDPDDRDDD